MKSILWVAAMTIRQEMIKAVSRSKAVMEDSISSVANFLTASINPDGGFKGRDKQSDLYYTVFGLEALIALGGTFPRNKIFNFIQIKISNRASNYLIRFIDSILFSSLLSIPSNSSIFVIKSVLPSR